MRTQSGYTLSHAIRMTILQLRANRLIRHKRYHMNRPHVQSQFLIGSKPRYVASTKSMVITAVIVASVFFALNAVKFHSDCATACQTSGK